MSRQEAERLLEEARQQRYRGDVAALRRVVARFEAVVKEAGLTEDPLVAHGWVYALYAERLEGKPEVVLVEGSKLARIARKRGWYAELAHILSLMARGALDLSDHDRSRVWLEEALACAEKADDDWQRTLAIMGLAHRWEHLGEPLHCLREAERAKPFAERCGDPVLHASVLTTIGRVHLRLGQTDGEAHLVRAEAMLEEANAHVMLMATLLDHLGFPMAEGDLDAAEALILRAQALADHVQDRVCLGRLYLDSGELLRMRGDLRGAISRYRRALDVLPEGHPTSRVALLNLAITQIAHGSREKVRKRIPLLLKVTQGHALYHGMAHLLALAAGPRSAGEEDELWLAHGTPARLPLRDLGHEPDITLMAHVACRRMLERADPIQAGRAALILGIATEPDEGLVQAIRRARGAIPIGPFLAIQRIGAGGMGEVWLGRHVDTDMPAAVKVVNPESACNVRAFASFENELRAIATLNHPNIVRLLDHGLAGRAASWLSGGRLDPASPYLALEFVRGGPISRWMGKMSWPQVRRVLSDLLNALAHAHARRVLHLDLKPDNVLLNEPGKPEGGVRLTDFGLALLRDHSREGMAGTLYFMAPEQFVGRDLGPSTDLYALGCMAWGMLTDRAPFEAPTRLEMQSLHAVGDLPPFEPLVEVPDGLLGWLRTLLAKNPKDRFRRASSALDALRAIDPETPPLQREASSTTFVIADAGLSLARERQPRLVGHEAERERLWEALLSCRARGRPAAVELRGPLGSGRNAVATWLATRAHEEGLAEVIWHDAEAGLASLLEGPAPLSAGSLALRLSRTFDELREDRMAVVVAQAEDPDLPEVLDILLREGQGPLFFVVRSPPGQLRRNRSVEQIRLQSLSDDELRQLLRSLLPLEPGFESRLIRWSEGNAGLALSTVRDLARRGDLRPTQSGWNVPHFQAFTVPGSMAAPLEELLRRIGQSPSRWEAIQFAAALGSRVDGTLWAELAEAKDEVEGALEEALLLDRVEDGYRWIQPAARYVVLQGRSVRVVHGKIAHHLQKIGGSNKDIGRHYVAAHLYADAHRPLLDAVTEALDAGDLALAKELYAEWSTALDRLAAPKNDPRRLAGQKVASRLKRGRRTPGA